MYCNTTILLAPPPITLILLLNMMLKRVIYIIQGLTVSKYPSQNLEGLSDSQVMLCYYLSGRCALRELNAFQICFDG